MNLKELFKDTIRGGLDVEFERYIEAIKNVESRNDVSDPVISVIVIAWKFHPNTIKSFEKLKKQRHDVPFELIFVNNGANDEELQMLVPFVDKYISLNYNVGICVGRNIGAQYAKAPILLFLDDDGIPDEDFVISHLLCHRRFDVLIVRGNSIPLTEHPSNERPSKYYIGNEFFPAIPYLEGNVSIKKDVFFEVGGWNEEITYGGEGKELSMRIFKLYPQSFKQMYSPMSLIYHDNEMDEERLAQKTILMAESDHKLSMKYHDWKTYDEKWEEFYNKPGALVELDEWKADFENQKLFNNIRHKVWERNKFAVQKYMSNKVFWYDEERILDIYKKSETRNICIFGTGVVGEKVFRSLKRYNIPVACFVDNNRSLWDSEKQGVPVINPKKLTKDNFIFIASGWRLDIAQQLEIMGFIEKEDYIAII
ncbi:glycosyltransferase family 2 protein [Paenibacillus barengoltzii]|uniref:glycosyltransferase family 2 protein n=1 Tax=Paenibacillus barengoltzii TaxID=343517 RepID=UPI003879C67A